MMYVFHVDQGRMLTFEMNWMFEDIRKLKEVIERNHAIPASSIVLLVSGGELLEDHSRVCKYATGTDTNPIYMFSTKLGESPLPSPGPSKETEVDLEGLVKKSLELPVSYATVAARAQLAQKICEMGREELRRCESLVHEQHLQQQGWAAVVANMEDTVKEFTERCEDFNRFYEEQIRQHEEQMDILKNFDNNLQQLADIPILSTLMENTELRPYGMFDEPLNQNGNNGSVQSQRHSGSVPKTSESGEAAETQATGEPQEARVEGEGGEIVTSSETEHPAPAAVPGAGDGGLTEVERAKGISLLDWISASEGQLTLRRMAEECRIGMEKFSRQQLITLNERIQKTVKPSQSDDIRIVKGLEERLCGLDQLLAEAKKTVQDQNELAQSIQMNLTRANTLGDTSILSDLCSMHRNHLKLMKENHSRMLENRRRCQASKIELGKHLTRRLDYIMGLETKVCDLDSHLLFYYTSLKRLQKHLSIIEQIHMAPCMYVSAVTEVVRRRMFSSSFLRWASDLACRLMTIHNEEVARRQDFTSQFEGHFLSTLFPGMNDMPPSYAIQAPSVFDSSLPALDKQDLQELSRFLPELTEKIPLPNISSVIDFFQTRSVEQQTQKQQTSSSGDAGKDDASLAPGQQSAKDGDRVGVESETDTEEFEKVQNQTGVAAEAATAAAAAAVLMCSVATSTEPVETVSAETLTEVRLNDSTLPTTTTTTRTINNNTTTTTTITTTNTLLTTSTTITTITNNDNDSIVNVAKGERARTAVAEAVGCPAIPEETPSAVRPGSTSSATPRADEADGGGVGIASSRSSKPPYSATGGSCSLGDPGGGRKLVRRGLLTRTSSSSERSASQELLLLALMDTGVGGNNSALLRSPAGEGEFINSEFYIDESLPSSAASVERRQQLEQQQQEIRQALADCLGTRGRGSYDEGTIILLLQDNLGTTRLEVERLKGLLGSVHQLSRDSIAMLRGQLARVRAESETNRTQFQSDLCAINRAWNDIQEVARNRERETIQRLTVDHELEMNDLRKSIHQKDDEIQSLRADNSTMKASQIETVSSYEQEKRELVDKIEQMQAVIGRLERQLAESEVDRKRAIQEAVEQLEHKHRTEIETLRCRFKLMATSMDRSPSDTSLEKIERPDMIDTGTHEQVLAQLREEFAREKERAIRTAVEEERQRWEANATGGGSNRLHRSHASAGSPGGSQDVYKRILEEKDRQLEEAREKEALLVRENQRMKETIQSLADPELSLNDVNYREQLEALEGDRRQLAEQLATQHTSVERLQSEKKTLARELDKQRKHSAQLLTCSEGDTVSFVWNPTYGQYTIVQASEFHFFLHEKCYPELGLEPLVMGEVPAVLFGYGTVTKKEFCHARKDDNRYRVSRDTRFYRVKLKPANVYKKSKGERLEKSGVGVENVSTQQPSPPAVVTIEVQSSGTGGATTVSSGTTGRYLDSFAQTEQQTHAVPQLRRSAMTTMIGSPIDDGSKSPTGSTASRDMIDSGVAEQQRSSYRERNISITDEEDIAVRPVGIGSDGSIDRIRYQSVCEEEDPAEDDADGGGSGSLTDCGGDGIGGGSSATGYLSCYSTATTTTSATTDSSTVVPVRAPPLVAGGGGLEGSCDDSSIGPAVAIAFDSGNNSEASETVSSSGAAHLLAAFPSGHPQNLALAQSSTGFGSIADDVSDSADSEYRSLEANDPEDSDSAPVPPPPAIGH